MDIDLSEWTKRAYVMGVTTVTYIWIYKSRMRRPEEVRILNPSPFWIKEKYDFSFLI